MSEEPQNKGAGHRQRLRDKFLELGIEAFTDSEVIEVLLSFGLKQQRLQQPAGQPRKDRCQQYHANGHRMIGGAAVVLFVWQLLRDYLPCPVFLRADGAATATEGGKGGIHD